MDMSYEVTIPPPPAPPVPELVTAIEPASFLDYDPNGYRIFPCEFCSSWWAEVDRGGDGLQVVREWHDPHCRFLIESQ